MDAEAAAVPRARLQVAAAQRDALAHADEAAEGVRAFAEKRPPDFGPFRGASSRT